MAVGIPLPELDVSKPTPAPFPDALSEFQRASQLQTAAAQQQQIQAQTTGVQQQNQLTALQVKDMQTIHDLAPQFVQKDENGKPTGFDNEGFANAARGAGVNPLIVNTMQQQYAATVKSLADAGKAQIDTEKDRNANAFEASESMRAVSRKLYGQSSAPATAAPGATPAPAQPGGVPPLAASPSGIPGLQGGAPLVNGQIAASPAPAVPSAVSPIGSAPAGSPESLGKPPDGEAATPTESSLQAVGPQASPEDMSAYHQFLMKMMRLNVNISQLDPNHIPTEKQLDSFQAGLGAHAQAAADAEQAAKTAEMAGKAKQSEAEATKADNIPMPELGVVYHPSTGTATSVTGGQVFSPAMIESKYITDQMAKGMSFDQAVAKYKDISKQFSVNNPIPNYQLVENGKNPDGSPHMSLFNPKTGGITEAAGPGAGTIQPKGTNAPTQAMKTAAYRADTALAGIPDVINDVDRMKDKLGPVMGRWNEFMQGKVGADDPDFAGLRADMTLLSTAVTLAHAQGRMSDALRQDFQTMLNQPKQSPENIKAVLGKVQTWMQRQSNVYHGGTPSTPPPNQLPAPSGKAVSLAAARQLPQNQGKTDAQITADIQRYGHTVAP